MKQTNVTTFNILGERLEIEQGIIDIKADYKRLSEVDILEDGLETNYKVLSEYVDLTINPINFSDKDFNNIGIIVKLSKKVIDEGPTYIMDTIFYFWKRVYNIPSTEVLYYSENKKQLEDIINTIIHYAKDMNKDE